MSQGRIVDFSALTFQTAILDSLSAHIAVLDATGTIVAVNQSWQAFARENGLKEGRAGIGSNYLDVCRSADPDPKALQALEGINGVMSGRLSSFYMKYPCHSSAKLRWFVVRASPLLDHENFVVVSHENITEQVLERISPRPAR